MQLIHIDLGQVAPWLIFLAIFGFFVFAFVKARARRRAAFEDVDRRERLEPPEARRETEALAEEALESGAPAARAKAEPEVGHPPPERRPEPPSAAPPTAIDPRLQKGLRRTQEGLIARLGGLFRGKEIPPDLLDQIEAILLTSDLGVKTTTALLAQVKEQLSHQALKDEAALSAALEAEIRRVFAEVRAAPWQVPAARPAVILIVGVNGVGKTTTIGKLATYLRGQGLKVLVAAGDTFRAAASDQLKVWAERAGAEYYAGAQGKDPASVVFEACQKGAALGVDVVLADTAGRLHTKTNLMEELKKVKRVVGKVVDGAPHEVFLVVDATSGQNAVTQAREFNEALGLTGIVLTKLDGTAKGGVVVAIGAELKIPIRFVGVGETAEDLRPFDAEHFTRALFARG